MSQSAALDPRSAAARATIDRVVLLALAGRSTRGEVFEAVGEVLTGVVGGLRPRHVYLALRRLVEQGLVRRSGPANAPRYERTTAKSVPQGEKQ